MDTLTNKEVIAEVRKLKEKLAGRYDIEKAILFGSRARGDYLLDSDVDLLLVSRSFSENFTQRIREVAREWDALVPLEPVCYTPAEFEEMKKRHGIARQAAAEGIPI
jgi:predicted nucleotidyltransferase